MSASPVEAWQHVAVGLAVAASVLYLVHARAPSLSRRCRMAVAVPLVREGRPAWMKRLGRRIAPPRTRAAACAGCDGCASGR
ncbi:MAG: DUF6587 family protein [Lysobacteraceae bacterium]|jgi:hypothetical protein|nr:hypothetical protein [Xanthomonadaceae bacterium]MCZ8318290.1 hypothetical protein [Silanimonas sp.]